MKKWLIVFILLLLASLPLCAKEPVNPIKISGSEWLSWSKSARLAYLVGITHGELETIIRIHNQLVARGADSDACQANLIPFVLYVGTLEELSVKITEAARQAPEKDLFDLTVAMRWEMYPVENIEKVEQLDIKIR